ncbi:hypothetical protein [Lewinella sp. IMCC34191]|uniref:hypothetical protein n=1 Tax=Lewinella sp. IMCC34191 TaxID=2259172 RepID=UPI000E22F93A|nr:hypothetical protein [Lewinella sp. IMCC34191]
MKVFLSLFLLIGTTALQAQADTTYSPPIPRMELSDLAGYYINLDWSPAQWDSLQGSLVELAFYVDEIGEPYLNYARGFESPAIFDRLVEATGRLTYFEPAKRGDSPEGGEYLFWITFPRFGEGQFQWERIYGNLPAKMNTDSLRKSFYRSRNAVFVDMNIYYSNYTGNAGTYLSGGFGLDVTIGGRWSDRIGAGVILGLEGNDRHRSFPDDPFPERDEWSSGLFAGGMLDYLLLLRDKSYLSVRPEVAYGLLNAANRIDPDDEEGWVQYRGLHTGVVIHYSFRLGKYVPNLPFSNDYTSARFNAFGLETGFRYRYYGDKAGTGGYWFIGLGWRFGRDDFRRNGTR